ncbi:putative N-acetyl-gamma-glutamyl-phosphate reductase, chloroplastic [Gossypium australe]|uniref:Putative N-acetyl-gamma-glutamyl-phosphate reductase, chloroplastic n=1 Tax=Gossypium australe TaxID=47621 RepID=A0A5B6VWF2_9ROSI|nr:putative N-acetyl-gamma-glutamyl-phosphate reductase, chloroplastic [Gossypium australe]
MPIEDLILMTAGLRQDVVCCLVAILSPGALRNSRSYCRGGIKNATADIMWLESLLEELHVQLDDKTVLWCDNSTAVLHSKFKHVELDLYFVLGRVAAGKLIVEVPASHQVVDILSNLCLHCSFAK